MEYSIFILFKLVVQKLLQYHQGQFLIVLFMNFKKFQEKDISSLKLNYPFFFVIVAELILTTMYSKFSI
jgi:hypothetical protein